MCCPGCGRRLLIRSKRSGRRTRLVLGWIVSAVIGLAIGFFAWHSSDPLPSRMTDLERVAVVTATPLAPDVMHRVKQATAYVRVILPNGTVSEGSGFFAGEAATLVTSAHVLGVLEADSAPPTSIEIIVHGVETSNLKGKTLAIGRDSDLALVQVVGGANLPAPLTVRAAGKLTELEKLYLFGYPLGKNVGATVNVTEGTVSGLRKNSAGALVQIQLVGDMQPGHSGGPIVDAAGEVVGVSLAVIKGTRINFAVPGDYVERLFAEADTKTLRPR